jgi:conflict system pore-forming effector with SLATT domain
MCATAKRLFVHGSGLACRVFAMFSLSVVEHLRLNFGLVVQSYTAHARAGERLAAAALKAKMVVLGLFALATASIVLSLLRPERGFHIAAALIAGVAFAVHVMAVAYGVDARVYAHRLLAHRLWQMCERYRGLLTEIQDGLVDDAAILHRRELLSEQVHAIYEQGFPFDEQAYESLRQLPLESGREAITDAQLDQLVPVARKAG